MSARGAGARNGRPPGVEARAGRFPGPSLIPALIQIQREHGWLERSELERLSRERHRPLYEIEGLISFYPHFRNEPPGAVEVAVCHDLSCWLAGAEQQIAELKARYGDDVSVHVREVSCLGRCEIAPALAVDEQPASSERAGELIEAARAGALERVEVSPRREPWPNDPYAPGEERYRVLRRVLAGELSAAQVIETLKSSGLRGMGGAGFPTGRKWELVAGQPAQPHYVICNADESEPGTFKDRQILTDQAHLVLEGLLLAMAACGAEQGYVFIRHEYGPEEQLLRAEIERLREQGIVCEGRQVDVFTSPGGYILGEESALIECMEGHRGEPRNKPPFPGTYGLWGMPTLMNSVETLAHVPVILERGAQWWRDQGEGDAVGWKFFAVSGDVERPGVYCVPMGTTVRALLERTGGVRGGLKLQAVQPGGASSNFIGPELLDTPLDFEPLARAGTMLGSGALVAVAEGRDLLAAATNVLRFFRNESCGKCVPCRTGSHKAHALLSELLERGGGIDDVDSEQLEELEATLRLTSICGLGQVALGPVISVLRMARAKASA
jgi:NADH:ubiquinone oxidoreductase subunit F (NADH-binding)/NADH:ubiquinone oxidoreductase subunit E